MAHVGVAAPQGHLLLLPGEPRPQPLQRLGLELAAHQLHLAAVQLFHRAVALGQQVLPHQQLVDAVPHKGQGQGA